MGTRQIGLQDVRHGLPPSRLRLLAPLRYLQIENDEKAKYDLFLPLVVSVVAWLAYVFLLPGIAIFGDNGLLRFARDLLVMAVPFMVGALAAVAMGAPGPHMDKRPVGAELFLDGKTLTLRQFVCYLLGYLSFLGMITLICVVSASLLHDTIVNWLNLFPYAHWLVKTFASLILSVLLSALTITFFWGLYFLTDIVNRT